MTANSGSFERKLWDAFEGIPSTGASTFSLGRATLDYMLETFMSHVARAANEEAEYVNSPDKLLMDSIEDCFTDCIRMQFTDPEGAVSINAKTDLIIVANDDEAYEYNDDGRLIYNEEGLRYELHGGFEGLTYGVCAGALRGDDTPETATIIRETLDTTQMPCLYLYFRDPVVAAVKQSGGKSTESLPGLWCTTQYNLT